MTRARKPLYLDGAEPLVVRLDGAALTVRKPHSHDHRYPLARVSRVVVAGDVAWATNALLACADAGIVVCFLRADGCPRARWIGQPSSRSTFAQHWRDFLDRPDWDDLYREWRINARRHAVGFCALRLQRPGCRTRDLLQAAGGSNDLQTLRKIKRLLYGLAHARSLEELTKIGLSAADPSLRLVAPDLAQAIQWGLHPELVAWMRHHKHPTKKKVTAFFERHTSVVEFHLHTTLRRLSRFLEETT